MKTKQYAFFAVLALMASPTLFGCATTKKSTQKYKYAHTEQVSKETETTSTLRYVDTTHTNTHRVIITEIEFYPLAIDNMDEVEDGSSGLDKGNVKGISIPDVGSIESAAVRFIKQTIIETISEEKGKSLESEDKEDEVIRSEAIERREEKLKDEEPIHRKNRWRLYLYGLSAILILVAFLNRSRIRKWLITFIGNARKLR